MPLLEIATVRLHPRFSSSPPEPFNATWTNACHLATKAANGVPFQLYHALPPVDKDLYYLVGGWQTGEDHIAFLTTPDAVTLAKSIGQYMAADIVRHISGDIGGLKQEDGSRPKRLRVALYDVPEVKVADWEAKWKNSQGAASGSGGWDLSASVQKQHKAFRQMAEATNSAGAFGGTDQGGCKTWVWVDEGKDASVNMGGVDAEVFQMEYVLG